MSFSLPKITLIVKVNYYLATVNAPANICSDGQSEMYAVTIVRVAGEWRDLESAGAFEVPAPPAAPGWPPVYVGNLFAKIKMNGIRLC
jgi:hypothetical protein